MISPSKEYVDKFTELFGANTNLVIECFKLQYEHVPIEIEAATPQKLVDALFIAFVSGMVQVLTPGSKFNSEYKCT